MKRVSQLPYTILLTLQKSLSTFRTGFQIILVFGSIYYLYKIGVFNKPLQTISKYWNKKKKNSLPFIEDFSIDISEYSPNLSKFPLKVSLNEKYSKYASLSIAICTWIFKQFNDEFQSNEIQIEKLKESIIQECLKSENIR